MPLTINAWVKHQSATGCNYISCACQPVPVTYLKHLMMFRSVLHAKHLQFHYFALVRTQKWDYLNQHPDDSLYVKDHHWSAVYLGLPFFFVVCLFHHRNDHATVCILQYCYEKLDVCISMHMHAERPGAWCDSSVRSYRPHQAALARTPRTCCWLLAIIARL